MTTHSPKSAFEYASVLINNNTAQNKIRRMRYLPLLTIHSYPSFAGYCRITNIPFRNVNRCTHRAHFSRAAASPAAWRWLAVMRRALSWSVPVNDEFSLFSKDCVKGKFAVIGRIGFNGYSHICELVEAFCFRCAL